MGENITYTISQSESLIMDFLWKEECGKEFNEIMEFLNEEYGKEWKKQTVSTFLTRLADKGLVITKKNGRNKIYYTAMTKSEYEKGRARDILKTFYNGSIGTFLTALTGGQHIDKEFADELRELVDKED